MSLVDAAPEATGDRIAAMTATGSLMATAGLARSPAYDVVLLAHVLSALVGFGAVVVSGGYALALLRSGPASEAVRRYYRPGVNWAGRILFLVPVLGVALIAMSHGRWSYSDGWIGLGLVLWAFAALVAEMALWPAERQLQVAVSDQVAVADPSPVANPSPAADLTADTDLRSLCFRVVLLAALLFVLAVVAAVVMVAKP